MSSTKQEEEEEEHTPRTNRLPLRAQTTPTETCVLHLVVILEGDQKQVSVPHFPILLFSQYLPGCHQNSKQVINTHQYEVCCDVGLCFCFVPPPHPDGGLSLIFIHCGHGKPFETSMEINLT